MPGELHELIVGDLCHRAGYSAGEGFRPAVKRLIPDADPGDYMAVRARPDAYLIDHENQTIVAAEVDITSPVSDAKMERYSDLYWFLSFHDWDLVLLVVNRFGNAVALDMGMAAIERIVAEAEKRRNAEH